MSKYEEIYKITPTDVGEGIHTFPDVQGAYWTDGALDVSEQAGRLDLATKLGIKLKDLVCFSQLNHTNEVVVVDSADGLSVLDPIYEGAVGVSKLIVEGGWSEPIRTAQTSPEKGVERRTYDGVILVSSTGLENKHLLVTGADCTPVGIRGRLISGEEVIAVAHGGRGGTMTGIIDNLALRLQFLGIIPETVEVFVGPAAQDIELPLGMLATESTAGNPRPDNSWRVKSVSGDYIAEDGRTKVRYNNQYDTSRRIIEQLGISPDQVKMVDKDTVSDPGFHSFRREQTSSRNCLVVGFTK